MIRALLSLLNQILCAIDEMARALLNDDIGEDE